VIRSVFQGTSRLDLVGRAGNRVAVEIVRRGGQAGDGGGGATRRRAVFALLDD
jgi:hypothetical protein